MEHEHLPISSKILPFLAVFLCFCLLLLLVGLLRLHLTDRADAPALTLVPDFDDANTELLPGDSRTYRLTVSPQYRHVRLRADFAAEDEALAAQLHVSIRAAASDETLYDDLLCRVDALRIPAGDWRVTLSLPTTATNDCRQAFAQGTFSGRIDTFAISSAVWICLLAVPIGIALFAGIFALRTLRHGHGEGRQYA